MIIKDLKKDVFTIPNMLSIFRLLLVPVYISIYFNATENSHYYIAGGILAVSCLTDMIDGHIARKFNMRSVLGQLLDPLADKVTQFALILCLTIRYPVLIYVIILFLVKELYQFIAMLIYIRKRRILNGAQYSGKICTTLLFISLIALIIFPTMPEIVVNIIAALNGLSLAVAFIDYATAYLPKRNKLVNLDREN